MSKGEIGSAARSRIMAEEEYSSDGKRNIFRSI